MLVEKIRRNIGWKADMVRIEITIIMYLELFGMFRRNLLRNSLTITGLIRMEKTFCCDIFMKQNENTSECYNVTNCTQNFKNAIFFFQKSFRSVGRISDP